MNCLRQHKHIALAACIIIFLAGFSIAELLSKHRNKTMSAPLVVIDTHHANYKYFIDGYDSNYFTTNDAVVKNIVLKYLTKEYPYVVSDAQKYGYSRVVYYDTDKFIEAQITDLFSLWNISAYIMRSMKNGQEISQCNIYARAGGLYKDQDLLASASLNKTPSSPAEGICLYKRGVDNFKFIDLSKILNKDETLFKDASGQELSSQIKTVDTDKKLITISVFSKNRADSKGHNPYTRDLTVSY